MTSAQIEANGILVLGLGELGTAIVKAFLSHPLYDIEKSPLSVMIRPETIASPTADKAAQIASLSSQGVTFIGGNIESGDTTQLSELFRPYHTVIHAGGMTIKPGTQLTITQAVLKTGTNKFYIPWQFGVDYDVIGRQGGQGMFSEQLDVRDLLRSQTDVQWLIVSCGVFMTFLFENFWGVVVTSLRDDNDNDDRSIEDAVKKNTNRNVITKVRALGSWDDLLTVTTAEDIGKCTADVVLSSSEDPELPVTSTSTSPSPLRNQSIYISGDSLKYSEFADLIDKHNIDHGSDKIEREVWTTDHLRQESVNDPDDRLKRYRVVFSEGRGLVWPKEETYNQRKGISMTSVEDYLRTQRT